MKINQNFPKDECFISLFNFNMIKDGIFDQFFDVNTLNVNRLM